MSKIIDEMPLEELNNEVIGEFKHCIYKNESNSFSVCSFYLRTHEDHAKVYGMATVTGYNLPEYKDVKYRMLGNWVNNRKYGKQFNITSCEQYVSKDKDGIVAYLGCGIIEGIGKKRAEDIYAHFGNEALDILDKDPNRLLEVRGIGKAALDKIKKSYMSTKLSRDITKWFMELGISAETAVKIIGIYKEKSKTHIQKYPYCLTRFRELSFERVDAIALKLGVSEDSPERFFECAKHLLKTHEQTGNLGMALNDFGGNMLRLLKSQRIDGNYINTRTIELLQEKKLYCKRPDGKQYIFMGSVVEMEKEDAQKIIALSSDKDLSKEVTCEDILENNDLPFKLDEIQMNAVREAMKENFTVITGGPGTGKTTIIRLIINKFKESFPENEVVLLAPTGKAARRMEETTGEYATTIHSRLQLGMMIENEEKVESDITISNALVIIDEFSMVDARLFHSLITSVETGCKVVVVGDVAQLPSIRAGAVLRAIIESDVVKVIRLETIYRQDEYSEIYRNARRIHKGDAQIRQGKDFEIVECSDLQEIAEKMAVTYMYDVVAYGIENVACILPFKEYAAGTKYMNHLLRERLNPSSEDKKELSIGGVIFREGDYVMHLDNRDNVANGDTGWITEIDVMNKEIKAFYHGEEVTYSMNDARDNIIHAYAITIHKAQGSEYTSVVTCLTNFHRVFHKRNVFYTDITRGKKIVHVYGERDAITKAILNDDDSRRVTLLDYFIKMYGGKFVAV